MPQIYLICDASCMDILYHNKTHYATIFVKQLQDALFFV